MIYLFMSGGPSQLDLFDYKPLLNQMNGQDLPESVRMGQRLTSMSANQATLPMAGSHLPVRPAREVGRVGQRALALHGARGRRALHHQFAVHRGDQPRPGDHVLPDRLDDRRAAVDGGLAELRPGLGQPEPADVLRADQPEAARPAAVFPALGQRVPAVGPPGGASSARGPTRCSTWRTRRASRRPAAARCSTGSASCTRSSTTRTLDPSIQARIAQYEMAYRMQTSVPEVTRVADEPDHIFDLYGPDSRQPGTFAANCLLARRLAERDVRFIQLYHPGWDHHGGLPGGIRQLCRETDQALRGPDPGPEAAGHAR